MAKIKTLSVSKTSEPILDRLNELRPNNISFSEMIAIASNEYIKNHDPNNMKIDDFDSEKKVVPSFYSDITVWRELIMKSDSGRLEEIQDRHIQIENLVRQREEVLMKRMQHLHIIQTSYMKYYHHQNTQKLLMH